MIKLLIVISTFIGSLILMIAFFPSSANVAFTVRDFGVTWAFIVAVILSYFALNMET